MSELQAAMGLSVLPHMHDILTDRSQQVSWYNERLINGALTSLVIRDSTDWNSGYYPVLFESESHLVSTVKTLNSDGVFPRRYFYPSLTQLPYVPHSTCDIATDVASRILCLPLYYGLSEDDLMNTVSILNNKINLK
jgi:dTDP-4-amino-4,6-dideoxygalactose transaminase